MREILGDQHNGAAVYRYGDRIYKPRSLAWERLFLSSNPIRAFIDREMKQEYGYSPFDYFPDLSFNEYSVERLEILPVVPYDFHPRTIGSIIGLLLWFGVGDLHNENVLIGKDRKTGLPVIAPIDIEVIFEEFLSSTQSLFLPSPNSKFKARSGLSNLTLTIGSQPEQIATGFYQCLSLLEKRKIPLLLIMISTSNFAFSPIRIVLRPTLEYANAIRDQNYTGFFPEEVIQMKSNCIPYFFRYLNSRKIFWRFESNTHELISNIAHLNLPRPLTLFDILLKKRNVNLITDLLKRDLRAIKTFAC